MKLIYILLALSLCFGCKSKRELSFHSEFKQEYQKQKDICEHEVSKRDSSGQKVTEIVSRKESDTETETTVKTTEYDTSKPINPETGKSPVLRETESTTITKKKDKEDSIGKQTEDSNVQNQNNRDKTDKSSSAQSSSNSGDVKQTENKTVFQIPWLWIAIGGGLALTVGFCVKKKINPIKLFLGM